MFSFLRCSKGGSICRLKVNGLPKWACYKKVLQTVKCRDTILSVPASALSMNEYNRIQNRCLDLAWWTLHGPGHNCTHVLCNSSEVIAKKCTISDMAEDLQAPDHTEQPLARRRMPMFV